MSNIDTSGGAYNPNLYIQQQNVQGTGQTQGVESSQQLQKDIIVRSTGTGLGTAPVPELGHPTLAPPTTDVASLTNASAWLAAPYQVVHMSEILKMVLTMMLAKRESDVTVGKEMTATKELGDAMAQNTMAQRTAEAAGHLAQAAAHGVAAGAGARNLAKSHAAEQAEKTEMGKIKDGKVSEDGAINKAHETRKKNIQKLEQKEKGEGGLDASEQSELKKMHTDHAKEVHRAEKEVRDRNRKIMTDISTQTELIRSAGQSAGGLGQAITTLIAGTYESENQKLQADSTINDKSMDQVGKARDSIDQTIGDLINGLNQFVQQQAQAFRFTKN